MQIFKTYFGGKGSSGTYQKIINKIQRHELLIIPFLGACSITRKIKNRKETIGIDIDPDVIDQWEKNDLGISLGNTCGIAYLENYKERSATCIYCDPPYLLATRKNKRPVYRHEMTKGQHGHFLDVVRHIASISKNTQILVSCYDGPLYEEKLRNFKKTSFKSMTRQGPATETLYYNFEPDILHDTSYVGNNRTERQRLKRKSERWVKNLKAMDPAERQKIIEAILEEFNI